MTAPSTGRIVHYTLTEADADSINGFRKDSRNAQQSPAGVAKIPTGYQDHVGNEVDGGDVVALIVTRAFPKNLVNGQLILDGNDTLWVTSVPEGDGRGQWAWPPRV
jgi:hypothetical protein